jgi:3-methyladenine DNA glycosylase AlkD
VRDKHEYERERIKNELLSMADPKYKDFSAKLTPTVAPERIIGVRIPSLRVYAKRLYKDGRASAIFTQEKHEYFEVDNLHAFLIEQIKDVSVCIEELDRFLPRIDNWATCDSLRPKALTANKDVLLRKISEWINSEHEYTVRFAIECLMLYYLDDDFDEKYLSLVASVKREEYYVKMMVAWYFSTALAKQWEQALPYLKEGKLSEWVHKKTIQKACESYRITAEQKNFLRNINIK